MAELGSQASVVYLDAEAAEWFQANVSKTKHMIIRNKKAQFSISSSGPSRPSYWKIASLFIPRDFVTPEAEFKEFEPRHKFKPRLKHVWFYLKLYSNFSRLKPALNRNRFLADLSRGSNSLNSDTG